MYLAEIVYLRPMKRGVSNLEEIKKSKRIYFCRNDGMCTDFVDTDRRVYCRDQCGNRQL